MGSGVDFQKREIKARGKVGGTKWILNNNYVYLI